MLPEIPGPSVNIVQGTGTSRQFAIQLILRRFSSALNRQLFFAAPKKRPHCCRRSGVHEVFTQTGMIARYVNDGAVPAPRGLILSI